MKKFILLLLIFLITQNGIIAQAADKQGENMTRTDICKDNYRTLFKGEALQTTGDDPEMMAILQEYIFGEVFSVGDLDI